MHVLVLTVGKLKEKYLLDGIREYLKRLTPYARVEVQEVADESCPENLSAAEEAQLKEREGAKLFRLIREQTYLIALDSHGKMYDSEEMANVISNLTISGRSDITFAIGGSLGLAPTLLKRADLVLSFSKLTFPHQLMRLILMEQLYRWFKIIRKEPYHK